MQHWKTDRDRVLELGCDGNFKLLRRMQNTSLLPMQIQLVFWTR